MSDVNPYQAPQSPFDASLAAAPVAAEGNFIPYGRIAPAGHGWQWIKVGFDLFQRAPGMWIGMLVVYFVVAVVTTVIPVVGQLAQPILNSVLLGGVVLGCKALDEGKELRLGHLFAGFQRHAGPLALLGLLNLAGMVIIAAVCAGLAFAAFMPEMLSLIHGTQEFDGIDTFAISMAAIGLLGVSLMIPLGMAAWFAPQLVVLHGQCPLEAMKQSLVAGFKNFLPSLVFGVASLALLLVAVIPLGLGLLVLVPTMLAANYAAGRDIFAPHGA